ncbi:MAG TPA: hypothetical protein VF276_13675 [Chloroflexia bacterium]
MIPDLAVLILKIRDYLVWLLPAYAAAILLTAALNTALARPASDAPRDPATPHSPGTPTAWLLARLLGGGPPPGALLALWAGTLTRALTTLALILTAAHDPLLAGLRLALALILSAGVAILAGRAATPAAPMPPAGGADPRARSATPPPPPGANPYVTPAVGADLRARPAAPPPPLLPGVPNLPDPAAAPSSRIPAWARALWQEASRLVDQTAGPLFAAALIGGLFTAWDPARAGVRALAGLGPWAAAPVAALTLLLPLPAGTDLPLIAALTTYNVPLPALLALMGGAPLFHAAQVRAVAAQYGRPAAALYLLGGLLLLIGLSMLLGTLFGGGLLPVL